MCRPRNGCSSALSDRPPWRQAQSGRQRSGGIPERGGSATEATPHRHPDRQSRQGNWRGHRCSRWPARQHRRLVLPIFVRPSFERHEVDKRRYDHALNVVERFDAADPLIEILERSRLHRGEPTVTVRVVWERMNLPIARGLRGLIYVLWELSQVDPSDLSILFAGPGRLRIGFAGIDSPVGQEPGDEVERAARRCWRTALRLQQAAGHR